MYDGHNQVTDKIKFTLRFLKAFTSISTFLIEQNFLFYYTEANSLPKRYKINQSSETSILRKNERDKLEAFKMRTWCNIENFSWKDRKTNQYV